MSTQPPASIDGPWDSDFGVVTIQCDPAPGNQLVAIKGSWYQEAGKQGIIESGSYRPTTGALSCHYLLPWSGVHGEAQFEFDGTMFVGTWTQDNSQSGKWRMWRQGQGQDAEIRRFYEQVEQRLLSNEIKRYIKLAPPRPLDLAVSARGVGPHWGTGQHVLALTDARHTTETPTTIFKHVQDWYARGIGEKGAGVLIFVFASSIPESVKQEILKGFAVNSSITVYGGFYDLVSHQHSLNSALDVEHDIFG